MIMTRANIWNELRRVNVGWVALALVCLVTVMWLAACGPKHYEDFDPLAHDGDWSGECVAHLIERGEITVTTESADSQVDRPTSEHIDYVVEKYLPLFKRFPHSYLIGRGLLRDEDGERTDEVGIKITVEKLVDQSTLPPEDRVPDCLEGVPVQIVVQKNDIIMGSHKSWSGGGSDGRTSGTLTGLARRNGTNDLMLVACQHVEGSPHVGFDLGLTSRERVYYYAL